MKWKKISFFLRIYPSSDKSLTGSEKIPNPEFGNDPRWDDGPSDSGGEQHSPSEFH